MTDHPRALIADDEPHLLDYMETQLAAAWPELRVSRAANGIQALELIDELAPQVVFLDIQMPGLNGIELAARLCQGGNPPRVVFTTAYDHYTLQAFEHAAFDYLLKPIGLERLSRTVARLKQALGTPAPAQVPEALAALLRQLGVGAPAPAPLQWIRAAKGQETRLVAIDEVIYFQSNDKYTSVYLADGECLIRTPLSKLKEQLDTQQFWQIHRGVIVAAKHVAGTRTDFRGRLHVRLKGRDEQLVVSRNYVDLFKQM
ncbi:LytTR family DNA-binding domain-containing protein [Massilia sp. IC2-476]|uniref:LytR/AlgR family response regulator transcription factor n=1 Tax=Massilia sp. IC2-476 TaxID=2887199 RepID=UPI001D1246EF|nr:LytTR family DNA-binding domain-containing protein [Massilia sp. IC2-476]MCC2970980.1 LytTR family DNA-binding domain-containing protein [Massilia sp. IC2-476]